MAELHIRFLALSAFGTELIRFAEHQDAPPSRFAVIAARFEIVGQ